MAARHHRAQNAMSRHVSGCFVQLPLKVYARWCGKVRPPLRRPYDVNAARRERRQ